MSPAYVQGPALLTACSAGQGAIVIVEGESSQEDAYFYGRWFGARAREVSFFPQNGWQKVRAAVSAGARGVAERPANAVSIPTTGGMDIHP